MNYLDIEIFTSEMLKLPRYRYIFAPQIYTYSYSLILCINSIYLYGVHSCGRGLHAYIQPVHVYGRRISLYLASSCISRVNIYIYIYIWNSFILQANISISSKFIHIGGQYLYIQPVHVYCRRISLCLGISCISQVNIYIYIYIYGIYSYCR